MPSIVTAPILLYSNIDILTAYHEYQRQYDFDDQNFERTLLFFINNTLFSQNTKIFFLKKLVRMLKQPMEKPFGKEINNYYLLHEAMASWEKRTLITEAEEIDLEWKVEHDIFKVRCHKAVEGLGVGLELRSYLGSLVFEKIFEEHKYNAETLTPVVMQHHDKRDIKALADIYSEHGQDPSDMFKRQLVRLAELTNEPDHYAYSGLFFSSCLDYLSQQEANSIANKIAQLISIDYYAKSTFAFIKIRKEMLLYWANENKIPLILKAVLKSEDHEIPINSFYSDLSYAKMADEFYTRFAAQGATLAVDQFISVYIAAPFDIQYKLLSARLIDEEKALTHLKELNDSYKKGNFSVVFPRTVAKQLKTINPTLYKEAIAQTVFVEKEGIQNDLELLRDILENKSQVHHEAQRLEIRKLKDLHLGFKTNAGPTILHVFEIIPQIYWPDLFIHFHTEIVYWSFPEEEAKEQKERLLNRKTLLNFPNEWENILYASLDTIFLNISKEGERKQIAEKALQSFLYPVFEKTSIYFPDLIDKIFKNFFLKQGPDSITIFTAFKKQNPKIYDQVASWLPSNLSERVNLIVKLLRIGFEPALFLPFVRNKEEIVETIFVLVKKRTEHIIYLLDKFSDDIQDIIFKTLYQFAEEEFITLLQTAFINLSNADLSTSLYIKFVIMLFSSSTNANINIFHIIDTDDRGKCLLLQKLSELTTWANYVYTAPPYLFLILFIITNQKNSRKLYLDIFTIILKKTM